MNFREFLKLHWARSVIEPWPFPENEAFVNEIEQVARDGGSITLDRDRGRGTTTLMLALADFAVSELGISYVMYLGEGRPNQMAEYLNAHLRDVWRSGKLVKGRREIQDSVVEFAWINESVRGRTRHIGGRLLRPQLVLVDVTVPHKPARLSAWQQRVNDAHGLHGPGAQPRIIICWTSEKG